MARSARPYQVLPPDPNAPRRLPPEQVAAMSPAEQDQMRLRHAQWRAEQDRLRAKNVGKPLILREPGAAMNPGPLIEDAARRVDNVVGSVVSGDILTPVVNAASTGMLNLQKLSASSPEEAALIQARYEAEKAAKAQAAAGQREAAAAQLQALQTGATPESQPAVTAPTANTSSPDLPTTMNDLRSITTQWEQLKRTLRDPNLTTEQKRDIQFRMEELANQGRDLRAQMPRERGVPSPSLNSPERIANARNISDFRPEDFGTPEKAAEFKATLDSNEARFAQQRQEELRTNPVSGRNELARLALAGGEAEARSRRVEQAVSERRMEAQRAEQMQSARDAAELRTIQNVGTTPGVSGATLDSALAGANAIGGQLAAKRLSKIPAEAAGQFNVQVRSLSAAADQLALLPPDERRQAALELLTGLGTDAETLAAKFAAASKLDDQSKALYEQALQVIGRITGMAG